MQRIGAGTAGRATALVRLPERTLANLRGRFLRDLAYEAERRRLFPWLAVAFGAGILVFFAAADGQPWLPAPLAAGAACLARAARLGARPWSMALVLECGFAFLGFSVAV